METETERKLQESGILGPSQRFAISRGSHFILKPCAVELASLPPIVEREHGQENRPTLIYTFPAEPIPHVLIFLSPLAWT
jgi:hypothetical protein